jgi:hypothetical protein
LQRVGQSIVNAIEELQRDNPDAHDGPEAIDRLGTPAEALRDGALRIRATAIITALRGRGFYVEIPTG